MVNLSHTLGMKVVAEGVEDFDQALALLRLGCTMAQGFFFARPMPPDDLISVLHRGLTVTDPRLALAGAAGMAAALNRQRP